MRCSTSGRLTPAAATLMRISSGFGAGRGRSADSRTSGPPGLLISTARIEVGRREVGRLMGDMIELMDPFTGEPRGSVSRRVRAGQGKPKIQCRAVQPRGSAQAADAHRGGVPEPGCRRARRGEALQERDLKV